MRKERKLVSTGNATIVRSDSEHGAYWVHWEKDGREYSEKVSNYSKLKSYERTVAFFDHDSDMLFLMPRYDYSPTTINHLRKFVMEVDCLCNFPVSIPKVNCENLRVKVCTGFSFTKDGERYAF